MDVEVNLDGNPVTLRPTLKAAKRVSAAGGFQNVVGRLQSGDIDYYILVVAAGLDKKTTEVEEKVFRSGLPALAESAVKYVNLLANGGRPFRQRQLKTVEIDGKTYAPVDDRGEVVYEDVPAGDEPAGEG